MSYASSYSFISRQHLRADSANITQHSTNDQRTKILTCSNSFQRHIDSWIMVQVLYMPSISHIHATGVKVSQSDEDTGDAASRCPKTKPDSIKPEDSSFHSTSVVLRCGMRSCSRLSGRYAWHRLMMHSTNVILTSASATNFYGSRHSICVHKAPTPAHKNPFKLLNVGSSLVMRNIHVPSKLSFIYQHI